jgi:pilus assembly protein Flp/PilA
MLEKVKTQLKSQRGQGLSEYGLIIALISVVCIGALIYLGPKIANRFFDIGDQIGNAKPASGGSGSGL